jgi:hypothetical protein
MKEKWTRELDKMKKAIFLAHLLQSPFHYFSGFCNHLLAHLLQSPSEPGKLLELTLLSFPGS